MTSVLRRIQLAFSGTTAGRRFQEEADVGVAAVLTCLRQLILEQEAKNHTTKSRKELFEDAIRMIETKSFEDQKKYVQEKVNEQVRTQFETLLQVLPFMQKQEDIHTKNYSVSGFAYQVDKKHTPTQIFQEKLGYSLHVEESSIPNAGKGVKVQGHILTGSAIAFFPGTVYVPEHLRKPHFLREVSNNPYARARFDSAIIDAKNELQIPARNALAVGHMINHPPAEVSPNVLPFAYDFPPEEPFTLEEYQELIPNHFVEYPSRLSMFGKRALVHGLVFLALSDIEDGEELFLNYRYNPNFPAPAWYTPVDLESDQEMWK